MRTAIIARAAALAIALPLGGCAGMNNPFTGQPLTAASIQAAAQAICGFLPTATSIASLLTASPAIGTAEAAAQLICGAVKQSKSARLGVAGPVSVVAIINGRPVRISGSFVQGARLR